MVLSYFTIYYEYDFHIPIPAFLHISPSSDHQYSCNCSFFFNIYLILIINLDNFLNQIESYNNHSIQSLNKQVKLYKQQFFQDFFENNKKMNINGSNTKVSYRQVSSQYIPQSIEPHQIKHNFVHETITVKNANNQIVQYAPKLIKAGYILGDPVAFIQENKLPQNYIAFSPNKSHVINDPIILNNETGQRWHMKPESFIDINHQQSDYRYRSFSGNQSRNTQVLNGSNNKSQIQTVSKAEFDRLSIQYQNLSNSYTQLLMSHTQTRQNSIAESSLIQQNSRLRQKVNYLQNILRQKQTKQLQQISSFSRSNAPSQITPQMQNALASLLQKYRDSILQQQTLLVDRFRLQCKQEQLNQRELKMHQKYASKNSSMRNSRNHSSHYRKN